MQMNQYTGYVTLGCYDALDLTSPLEMMIYVFHPRNDAMIIKLILERLNGLADGHEANAHGLVWGVFPVTDISAITLTGFSNLKKVDE